MSNKPYAATCAKKMKVTDLIKKSILCICLKGSLPITGPN
jgi:hypothetical protein